MDGTHKDHGETYVRGSGLEQGLFRGARRHHQAIRRMVWEAQSRMSQGAHATGALGRGRERERETETEKEKRDREGEKEREREIPDL